MKVSVHMPFPALTPAKNVLICFQHIRQASVLRGTLKFGGFLFRRVTRQASAILGMLNSGGSLFFLRSGFLPVPIVGVVP